MFKQQSLFCKTMTPLSSHNDVHCSISIWFKKIFLNLFKEHCSGLVQERCNSIANALELYLSCTNQWNDSIKGGHLPPALAGVASSGNMHTAHRQNMGSAQLPQSTRSHVGKPEEIEYWPQPHMLSLWGQSFYCSGPGHSQQGVLSAHFSGQPLIMPLITCS